MNTSLRSSPTTPGAPPSGRHREVSTSVSQIPSELVSRSDSPFGNLSVTNPPVVAVPVTARGWRPAVLRSHRESGQASVEYALVLLGAALVATLLIGWATKTELLGDLFDHVMSLIRGKAQ